MFKAKLVGFGVSVLLVCACSAERQDKLTDAQVQALIEQVKTASEEQNINQLISHFAPDATIHVSVDKDGSLQKMAMQLPEYKRMTRDAWTLTNDYQYQTLEIDVQVAADGESAVVDDLVVERYQVMGQRVSSRTQQRVTVKVINGAPKITSLAAQTTS